MMSHSLKNPKRSKAARAGKSERRRAVGSIKWLGRPKTYREHIAHALTLDKMFSASEIARILDLADSDTYIKIATGGLNRKATSGDALLTAWGAVKAITLIGAWRSNDPSSATGREKPNA